MTKAGTKAAARPRPSIAVDGGLEVIGAGFGRTGTSSLQEALEILGKGPCYHMRDVFKDPEGLDKWDKIGQGEKADWDDVFWGYKSTVDLPSTTYYKELCEHYPKAKVILTVRDEDKWAKSVSETIAPAHRVWSFLYLVTLVDRIKTRRFVTNTVWKPFCGGYGQARDKEALVRGFRKHNDEVQATVPAHKLLVFNVKEGWEPLCKFLQCPVPDVPFPHAWKGENFKAMSANKRRKTVKRLIGAGATLGLFSAIAVTIAGRRGGRSH